MRKLQRPGIDIQQREGGKGVFSLRDLGTPSMEFARLDQILLNIAMQLSTHGQGQHNPDSTHYQAGLTKASGAWLGLGYVFHFFF